MTVGPVSLEDYFILIWFYIIGVESIGIVQIAFQSFKKWTEVERKDIRIMPFLWKEKLRIQEESKPSTMGKRKLEGRTDGENDFIC